MANTVSHGGYYQSTMGSPPKTPNSTSKFPYPRSGPTNTPPFIPGYFTPPDSRENSPALGGTSPNPQGKSDLALQQFASSISATASESRAVSGHNAEKTLSEPWTPTESPSIIQEESFERPQPMPEKIKNPTSPIVQMGGFPPIHGTFGRAESRRYQRNNLITAPPSQLSKSIRSPTHRYKKSDASTIAPLPSTVYVPGVGDTVGSAASPDFGGERYNYYGHSRDRSVSDPISRFSPWSDTPPLSVGSPSISSPFLPLEPDTPVTATPPAPQIQYRSSVVSSQAELIGLWKATQKSGMGSESSIESGRTHVLNMYRQASPPKSRIPSKHPFASPENYTFGPNPQTPFYTMHALRENPEDDAFNELSFLRRDPVSGLDASVITLGLESPFRHTLPTRDGLIALLYPKEAVLSAMLPLSPITDGADDAPRKLRVHEQRTREAIQNAYATECCRLSWNAARKRYYLYHPGVAQGGDAYLVEIEGEVGFDCEDASGTIKLINVDTNETFTELDFNTGVLYVNTCATLKIPSDHMVDVAVATVLTVATVEGRRRRVVRMNQPQPSSSSSQSLSRGGKKEHKEKKRRGGCLSGLLRSLCF